MSISASFDQHQNITNAALARDNTTCHTIITYSLSTAVYYRPVPQPTPVHTYIVPDGPARSQETPAPSILQKRSPWPDDPSSSSPAPHNVKARSSSPPSSFLWKDVFAVQHVTSVGNCPTPTSSPSPGTLPTAIDHPTTDHDLNAAHRVNIHLAILVGGLTVGIVVIAILISVAGCILLSRRRKKKAKAGNQLSDVDDTLTCQSNNTVGSSRTTMSERRLKCQTGWQMKEFLHQGMYSPFSSGDLSPSSCDKLEILARSGTLSNPFQDRTCPWAPPHSVIPSSQPESFSDTCSTDAPSYLPGDDIRYTMPQGSTTALTEVSCAATIDSNSNSVCPTRLNLPTPPPSDPSTSTSHTTTANLSSLIKHKAFLSSMMSQPTMHPEALQPPHLSPPDPVLTPKSRPHSTQSFSGSVYSDSTHESMYWKNRAKS